tara:strand:- start:244 stop:519 length:276 start_codon:yes stop_codon:yes gene_type:complete
MSKYLNKNSIFIEQLFRIYKSHSGSILRTIIYTIGHFIIAASCVWYFTGASFLAAITDAIVEPLLNSIWYFVLDHYWASKIANRKDKLEEV